MPSNDREVFDYFRSSKEAAQEVEYLAYALFAFEKSEWLAHFTARTGNSPTQVEIDDWISNLSKYQFDGMRRQAIELFDVAARNYLKDEMEAADERALSSAIVAQMRNAGAWYKQLAMALTTAIVAPLILGGVILGARYYSTIPTPADIAKRGDLGVAPDAVKPQGR